MVWLWTAVEAEWGRGYAEQPSRNRPFALGILLDVAGITGLSRIAAC